MSNLMKATNYGGVIVILFVMIGVFGWLWNQRNSAPEPVDTTAKALDDLPLPLGSTPEMKFEKEFRAEDAKTVAGIKLESPSDRALDFVADLPITEEDRKEIEQMLTKFSNLGAKSEAEIIRILMDFYPEEERDEGLFQLLTRGYRNFDTYFTDPPFEKEERVFILLHAVQLELASGRKIAEEMKRKRLLPTDWDAEIQEIESEIPDAEALIREAEAEQDWKLADFHRNHLAALYERIEGLKLSQEFEAKQLAEAPQREAAAERRQYYDGLVSKFQPLIDLLKERGYSLSPDPDIGTALPSDVGVPATPSERPVPPVETSTVSPPPSFDPVKSLTTAQTALEPWRRVLDEKYFDVVVSQYLTPQELDQYFPTAAERKILKQRTSEMQKTVVSKIRKLVDDVKGATPDQKRSLARELVTKNFDKDFAQAVLSELEKETE